MVLRSFSEGGLCIMYYVYILRHRRDETLYKGFSEDLKQRIRDHQSGYSSTTSKKDGDYELIWYCGFLSKRDALQFEKYLKSGSGIAFTNKHLIVKESRI